MGQSVTFIDWYGVSNAVSRVQYDTGGTAGRVQGQHSLDGHVHSGRVERLKHDLQQRNQLHLVSNKA